MTILVVEDDLSLSDVLCFTLRRSGFDVLAVHDGLAALDCMGDGATQPGGPRSQSAQVGRPQRLSPDPRASDTPIIILTARGKRRRCVKGLELGADDYVVKPFSPTARRPHTAPCCAAPRAPPPCPPSSPLAASPWIGRATKPPSPVPCRSASPPWKRASSRL